MKNENDKITEIDKAVEKNYKLTDSELNAMRTLTAQEHVFKARIFDLNSALAIAQQELANAQARKSGALSLMIDARGWKRADLSEDLTTMTRKD